MLATSPTLTAGSKNDGVGTPLELASQTWTQTPSVATVAQLVQFVVVQHRADKEREREVGFVSQNHKITKYIIINIHLN